MRLQLEGHLAMYGQGPHHLSAEMEQQRAHELAHAYHDQVLGFEHPAIIAAYDKAKAAGNYEEVLAHTGRRVRHYGLTNHKEYFAEGTEAFFYRNDFYPFVRAELGVHDPTLLKLLTEIWEPAK